MNGILRIRENTGEVYDLKRKYGRGINDSREVDNIIYVKGLS